MQRSFAFLLSVASLIAAGHRTLLPQPQQINYGEGRFPVAGIQIGFASEPGPEDRFAASELAAALAQASHSQIRVAESLGTGPAIVLKRTGPAAALPQAEEKPGPDGRESYRIEITATAANVVAPSSAGLFYAVQTLRQMVEAEGPAAFLPAVEVHDWPSLAYRGFMMDLSHGSIMKEEEIRRQLDFLARWKANQYYFYSEAGIELKGYPLLNPRARYSQEQIRRIIEYARERHIDVVPCLEYYGHLHDLFRIERYADMAVLPHGGDLNPRHARSEALLKDWIGQMAELFPSPWFHVGLDEPFESGAVAKADAPVLYRKQLERVTGLVRSHGKRVLFWADINAGAQIFNKYPELVSKLPDGLVPVPWYYDAAPDYTKWVEPFGKAGKAQVVAPGITCWNDIYPDYHTTLANIDGFLAAGRKYGAIGVINTGWTDDAQNIYRAVLPGMAYGAVAAWQASPVGHATYFDAYARQMYAELVAREIGPALAALSEARDGLAKALGRDTMLRFWEDSLAPQRIRNAETHYEQLRQARLRAEDAVEHIDRAMEAAPGDPTLPSLRLAAGMLDYLGMKHLYAADIAGFFHRAGRKPSSDEIWVYLQYETSFHDHSHAADLMDRVMELKEDFAQAWDQEWTGYRRGTALGRWDAEYGYWRAFQARVMDFTEHMKEGGAMPPLDSFRPKQQ